MANPQPTDAHLRIAHKILEQLMVSDFSKRQMSILLFILRLSWGCGKKEAIIPHQKDFEQVGIYPGDVKMELDILERDGVIYRDGNSYGFNKNYDTWRVSRAKHYSEDKISELLILNLNGNPGRISKTLTAKLVKHEFTDKQNTNFSTPKLASPKESIKEIIKKDIYTLPDFIDKELWDAFLDMRKKKRVPPTDKAKELIIKKLEQLKADGQDPNEVLKQSIRTGWTDVYTLKDLQQKGNKKPPSAVGDDKWPRGL